MEYNNVSIYSFILSGLDIKKTYTLVWLSVILSGWTSKMQASSSSVFSFPLFVFLWLSLLFLRLPAETSAYFHTKPEHLSPSISNGNPRYLFPVYSIGLYSRLPVGFT